MATCGEVLAELNDFDGSIRRLKCGVELTERGSDVGIRAWSYLCLTRALFSRGGFGGC